MCRRTFWKTTSDSAEMFFRIKGVSNELEIKTHYRISTVHEATGSFKGQKLFWQKLEGEKARHTLEWEIGYNWSYYML